MIDDRIARDWAEPWPAVSQTDSGVVDDVARRHCHVDCHTQQSSNGPKVSTYYEGYATNCNGSMASGRSLLYQSLTITAPHFALPSEPVGIYWAKQLHVPKTNAAEEDASGDALCWLQFDAKKLPLPRGLGVPPSDNAPEKELCNGPNPPQAKHQVTH